jgi:hypothetical protein
MELTPMRVKFNGVDIGGTHNNVVLAMSYKKSPIKADQLGETDLDYRVSGHEFKVTTELAEIKNKDIWKVALPNARLVTSGPNKMIYAESQIGDSDLANHAFNLVLHPLSLQDSDLSGDYKFFKAVAESVTEITYGPTTQGALKIVWKILPDTTVQPARFFVHGDPGIGLVAASAGSPSFSGTGNGTMTSVTVQSGVTVTETITATLVTAAANGGVFFVSGSVSGPLGLATVGVAFVSGQISFTINDGSTDFVLNDAFTVATTAANYI